MSPRKRKRRGIVFRLLSAPWTFLKRQSYILSNQLRQSNNSRRSVLKSVIWLVTLPFQLMTGLFRAIGTTIYTWWNATDSRALIRGLPALVLFILTGYAIASAMVRSENVFANSYIEAADNAFQKEDYQTARLLYDRLVANGEKSPEILYRLAVSTEQMGDHQRAKTIIISLAPDDQPGYAPAHVKRAHTILVTNDLILAKRLAQAKIHLEYALTDDPVNSEAHGLLAKIYSAHQRWEDAIKHLKPIVSRNPEQLMQLAIMYAANNEKEKAKRTAEQARKYFQKVVDENPSQVHGRLRLAESLSFAEKFQTAIVVLKDGLLHEDNTQLKAAIAKVYITWSDSIPKDTIQDRQLQFQLLSQALLTDNRDLRLFDRMMNVLQAEDEVSESARQFLNQNLVDGRDVPMTHLLLGTDAGTRGDYKESIFHLRLAQKLNPNMVIVGNNLAWYMAEREDSDLDQALKLINSVLEMTSSHLPQFYDTRGFILQKMGKYESALVDYQRALPQMTGDYGIHFRLSKLYEELNNPELAQKHLERSEQLQQLLQKEREVRLD